MRLTYNSALVLQALAKGCSYGFDIMDFTGLASGTTYPILRRFERDAFVKSTWEPRGEAHRAGRPARRIYTLTERGREALAAAAERFEAHRKIFAPEPTR